MADGPSAEDSSSSFESASSATATTAAAATIATTGSGSATPVTIAAIAEEGSGARVPRERHKRPSSSESSSSSFCSMQLPSGKQQRHSSSEDPSSRRGTRQQQQQQQQQQHSEEAATLPGGNTLKIASAVVLVERSEIAILENRKKLKVPGASSSSNSSSGPVITVSAGGVGGAVRKDAKKDKDKVGAAGNVLLIDISSNDSDEVMDFVDTVLQDNQKQHQRKKTRAATAAEAKKAAAVAGSKTRVIEDGGEGGVGGGGTLAPVVGPCAKKRCADRYDSSESSDSGVAISCGDCSSSNSSLSSNLSLSSGSSTTGSDITEPGSPCSTTSSSDEGVSGVLSSSSSSSSSGSATIEDQGSNAGSRSKLAPTQQQLSAPRPQWPWTPPLATTACTNTYKRFKAEPEHGSLPSRQAGQTDLGLRYGKGSAISTKAQQQYQDSQGKITEYFKAQIKPQQPKTKKNQSSDVTVLVAKTSPEFRRPAIVQRKNGNLSKQNTANSRALAAADWEVHTTLSQSMNGLQPRLNGKHHHHHHTADKKSKTTMTNVMKNAGLPILPIPSDVLATLPACKISNLRLTSEASPSESPPPILDSPISEQTNQFKDNVHAPKPIHMNENNNLPSNGCDKDIDSLFSRLILPPTPSDSTKDEDEEEESSRDSAESKPSSLESFSPILSAPTTIRFPAKAPGKSRGQTTDSGYCRWDKCGVNCDTSSALLEHLQAAHICTQTGGDNFVCHWQGCKVQGRSSCSRRWLERHVLSHGGNKPFQCIVDGCGSRFSSQTALERHVNGHFNQSESSSTASRKSTDSGGKLVRRNGKKLRYRRQPWSARIFDYFDPGVMESLQHRLLELAKTRTQGRLAETPGDSIALTSQVVAKRVELDGKTRVLLRWYPEDIEPDEWVMESEVSQTKHVTVRSVATKCPDEVSVALYPANGSRPPLQRVKQHRKPVRNT